MFGFKYERASAKETFEVEGSSANKFEYKQKLCPCFHLNKIHFSRTWGVERVICSGIVIAMCTFLFILIVVGIASMPKSSTPIDEIHALDNLMDVWVLAGQSNMVGFNDAVSF
jgi:hypothetical protein